MVPYTRLNKRKGKAGVESGKFICSIDAADSPSSSNRHNACLSIDNTRMREDYWKCKSGHDDERGEETSKVDRG